MGCVKVLIEINNATVHVCVWYVCVCGMCMCVYDMCVCVCAGEAEAVRSAAPAHGGAGHVFPGQHPSGLGLSCPPRSPPLSSLDSLTFTLRENISTFLSLSLISYSLYKTPLRFSFHNNYCFTPFTKACRFLFVVKYRFTPITRPLDYSLCLFLI